MYNLEDPTRESPPYTIVRNVDTQERALIYCGDINPVYIDLSITLVIVKCARDVLDYYICDIPEEYIGGNLDKDRAIILARELGIKHGKWLVFLSASEMEMLWDKIVYSCRCMKLDKYVICTRIKYGAYLVRITTYDFDDVDHVRTILNEIKNIGIYNKIYYKPHIYSMLNIYGEKAYMYASDF